MPCRCQFSTLCQGLVLWRKGSGKPVFSCIKQQTKTLVRLVACSVPGMASRQNIRRSCGGYKPIGLRLMVSASC